MSPIEKAIDESTDLLCRLAPELADGLYVVIGSRIGPAWGVAREFEYEGCTAPWLDLVLQPWCQPWRGRRPVIVVNEAQTESLATRFADDAGAPLGDCRRMMALVVLIHEAAHILERDPPYFSTPVQADTPDPQPLRLPTADDVASWLAEPLEARPPVVDQHGPKWMRLVLHLRHRAALRGQRLSAALLLSGYGTHRPGAYRAALESEVVAMENWPMEAVLATAPPAGFGELFSFTRGPKNMSTNVLSRVLERIEQRRSAHAEDFAELVNRLADGDDPGVDEVEAVLDRSGKSARDLEEAVKRLLQRRQLATEAARRAEAQRELTALQTKKTQVAAKLSQARREHDLAMAALTVHESGLLSAVALAKEAERELRRTADAKLLERDGAITAELEQLAARRRDLVNALELKRGLARELGAMAAKYPDDADVRKQADRATALVTQIEAAIADVEADQAALTAEQRGLYGAMAEA